jgi:glycosyltransferase involved in cell wall biosynthesis
MPSSKPIEVSVVIPCLNEEKTLGLVIGRALKAFKDNGIIGEVVVSDNGSTDKSVAIAKKAGARVVHQPIRGYGSAYLKGFAEAKGKYLVMADADDTYDVPALGTFIQPLREGCDFVIGDRFKGTIHPGAMPWHHYWIGNPVLSWVQRFLFNNNVRDSHCGMRAFTRKAYDRLELHTTGMEFASEMVIRANQEKLKIKQIPTNLRARPGGSESKLSSWRDGWRHLRFMLLMSPLHLFLLPGMFMIGFGGLLLGLLARGPVSFFGFIVDIHPMIIGAMLVILGYQTAMLGLYTRVYRITEYTRSSEEDLVERLRKFLTVDRGLLIGLMLTFIGLAIIALKFWHWYSTGHLDGIRSLIIASTLVVVGFQTMFSAFFLGILTIKHR